MYSGSQPEAFYSSRNFVSDLCHRVIATSTVDQVSTRPLSRVPLICFSHLRGINFAWSHAHDATDEGLPFRTLHVCAAVFQCLEIFVLVLYCFAREESLGKVLCGKSSCSLVMIIIMGHTVEWHLCVSHSTGSYHNRNLRYSLGPTQVESQPHPKSQSPRSQLKQPLTSHPENKTGKS